MQQSDRMSVLPVCPLAHRLLDRLTVIVGHCELLIATSSATSVLPQRLQVIQEAAQSMAAELKDYQCELIALHKRQENAAGRSTLG